MLQLHFDLCSLLFDGLGILGRDDAAAYLSRSGVVGSLWCCDRLVTWRHTTVLAYNSIIASM